MANAARVHGALTPAQVIHQVLRAACLALVALAALTGATRASPPIHPATATAAHARSYALSVTDYPRLANLYALQSASQVQSLERYGLIVAPESAALTGAVQALKAANPASKVVLYANTTTVTLPDFDGLTMYPGWWLTLVGTRLAAPIDASTTTIPVVDAAPIKRFLATAPDVLVDGETMHVLSVDTTRNMLTVVRGYDSTAAPHATGARLAAHASKWPGTWMANVTPYCPVDPKTGQTWVQYAAAHTAQLVAQGSWDGVLWDDGNYNFTQLFNGQIDANSDNVADGGDGPSGTGWFTGVQTLLRLTRALKPHALQLVTDATYPGLMDGEEMEHYPYYVGGGQDGFTSYLDLSGPGGQAPFTILNADAADKNDTSIIGPQNLQHMRYYLASALMGNGYFSYDGGPHEHGQTWWYDEYDRGAGSSIVAAVSASAPRLSLASGTGGRFKVGDVVQVPDGRGVNGDEQMLVTQRLNDVLTVERGYDGTVPSAHPTGSKVMTQQQIRGGLGWLGQPISPPTAKILHTTSMLANGGFTTPGPHWLSPWLFSVQGQAAATIVQDTQSHAGSGSSARITVTKATPDNAWYVSLVQMNTPGSTTLHLQAGQVYTVSFWARSSSGQHVVVEVQQSVPPWNDRLFHDFDLTNTWKQYSATFTATATERAVKLVISLGRSSGTIWLDDVRFQAGNPNFWRRAFTHGTVLLNATASPQTIHLGPGYKHIAGTQDRSINNGAVVTAVTVAPWDGMLLVKVES